MGGVTLFGPCVARVCMDCGKETYGLPEYPWPRCEVCSIAYFGVMRPAERIELRAPRGTLGPIGTGGAPFAVRARWTDAPAAPWPAPEAPCRPAVAGQIPRGALKLQRAAQGAGWTVLATWARGTKMGARGAPGAVVESLALRMEAGGSGWRAVAVWLDGKFADSWVWRPAAGTWPARLGAVELHTFLAGAELERVMEDRVARAARREVASQGTDNLPTEGMTNMKVAEFSTAPRVADGQRQYTKLNWAEVARVNDETGKPVELERGTDFTAKNAAAVVNQAKAWALKNGKLVRYEKVSEDALLIQIVPRPTVADAA